jgi:hypothetical protein
MRTPRIASKVLLAAGLTLSLPCFAAATGATRTFVSALTGNDANGCTVMSPCRTFANALTQTSAGGEIVALDSGGYGAVTITQSVSILAATGIYAGVSATSGVAVAINAGASDVVTLRGLTLNGQGGTDGIDFNSGGALSIESCLISGFSTKGIFVSAAPSTSSVSDTTVRDCGFEGMSVHVASVQASIDHCRFENNPFGFFALSSARASLRDSVISGSSSIAAGAQFGGELDIEDCLIANNGGTGIDSDLGGAVVRVSDTTVTDNGTGLVFGTGTLLSRGNNTVEGNGTNGSFSGSFSAK